MVYMTSLPGGWIADRCVGPRRAVLYGGVLIAGGHFSMAVPTLATFYLGLTLIVLGTGLLKGNVGVIVGRLYGQDDTRRDAAFSIFYMGINLGAFIAPLICGYLGQRISWHLGFAAAGFGMLIGLAQYVAGAKYLGDAGLYPATPQTPASPARVRSRATLWGTVAVALAGGLAAAAYRGLLPISATEVSDAAGYFLLLLMIGFFGWLYFGGGWTAGERKRLYVIGALFLASIVFWSEFEQAGSTLNLFGDRATRTSVLGWTFPSSYYQSLQPLFIITFAPVFAWLWTRMGRYEPSSPAKFAVGLVFVGSGFAVLVAAATIAAGGVKVAPYWLVVTYLLHTFGELSLSPVGMSAVTKLAPSRVTGLMMGLWYLGISVGNFIGGRLSSLYGSMPLPRLFGSIATVGVAAGLIVFALTPSIKRLMGEAS
jgi:POT family proton-dependent oligopeptide transporter